MFQVAFRVIFGSWEFVVFFLREVLKLLWGVWVFSGFTMVLLGISPSILLEDLLLTF